MAARQARNRQKSRTVAVSALAAAVLIGLAIVLAAVFWRRANVPAEPLSDVAHSDYVDGAVCGSCHGDVAATYRKTGMGRSFSRPTATNVVEDYLHANTLFHKASDLHYTMVEHDGAFYQQRSQTGFDGKATNVMEERIDYIIGSGNHSRSYLHRAADGQLIELPVSWYSERPGYWAMSPGYDGKGQKDFRRAITPECMFCHNGYPQGDADLDRSIFPAALPEGIDCQRCHGPGRAHVEAARSRHASPEVLSSTIVNPARLGRERQLEVCMQCHLETSHHEPNEQRLYDRQIFSYRPGEPMENFKLYFDRTGSQYDDNFEIAHAAYRLRKSACFRGSQMTCLTCHDPHYIPHGPQAVTHYTEVCLSCHQKVAHTVALPAGSTCISCHMPTRRTDDAVHVIMTDHFIRRTQPRRDLLAPITETVAPESAATKVALYYPEKSPGRPAAEIAIAEAEVNDGGIVRLQTLLEKYQPDAPEPYLALAKAYERVGNNQEVLRWSDQALTKRKDFRPAVVELVPALFATNQEVKAIGILEQAVARYPTDDLLLSDLGNAYLRQRQTELAAETLQRAVRANPDRTESHNLLGTIAAQRGNMDEAEREFREALRCQPDSAEANDNLGNLLIGKHSYEEAAFYLTKAVAADGEFAEAHHHLGRLLVLMDQLPHAIAELREAARESPTEPQVHQDLADVLAATGKAAEAITEYERVLALRPDQPQAHLGLGMALLGEHKETEARAHLQAAAASSDPEVAHAAAQILEHMAP